MTNYVFPPAPPVSLAVDGCDARFPVARVFCIGRNYRWSPDEPKPARMPAWFMKPATAVVPAQGALPYPPATAEFCHEVELVVAIGDGGRDIDPAHAASHIWGYAVGLDMTRRDLQQQARRAGDPWEPSKAFDHSAPCGPVVPVATCGHPRAGSIRLAVNGVARQQDDLSGLLFPVPELVAMLSRSVALMPGDLIFTGTPAGVGALQDGDRLDASIGGIGELSMTVAGPAP
ncbi:fumarylacetoacetate hydrolase family protein [Cupriavidus pauculus]|uniref:Fumarylacetoacetate hydrolase family protein n=1 Tax=Cupriavidus pauculus TaxID=82633 RepID=A0A5P2HE60_9BURK|nr:fumarylacetoacetate hydrolase family protein [Cupriavidus pauculus]QET05310.1 fumarylacetoacetate hydrolase family protein [Cupriavidus pauculus]